MRDLVCGIDPGKRGGVAFVSLTGEGEVFDMPEHILGLVELLETRASRICRVFVEKQHPFPKQGAVSTGRLMRHYGEILGAVAALKLPLEEVPPVRWQKRMLGNGRKTRNQSKALSLQKAARLFPYLEIGKKHGRSDALLIAEYGRLLLATGEVPR